jgi:hypothetical protein
MRLKIPSGVREIASKWSIRLIIRSGVRGIVSKWIIRSQLSIKGLLSATAISSDIPPYMDDTA